MTRSTLLAALLAVGGLHAVHTFADAGEPPADVAPSSLYELTLTKLDGTTMPAKELEGKAVLFVNVASKCGYTPQYEPLQALYAAHKDKGLVVVGVPSNQFLSQEPGSAEEIATFCKMNYGVEFPILEKQDVNGRGRSPLYQWLVHSNLGAGKAVGWNFEKFLVSPKGEVVGRWASKVTPDDPQITDAIAKVLPKS